MEFEIINAATFHPRAWFGNSWVELETKTPAFIYTSAPLRLICQGGDVGGEGKGHRRWHLNRPQINVALYLQATHGRPRPTATRLQSGPPDSADILDGSHLYRGGSIPFGDL